MKILFNSFIQLRLLEQMTNRSIRHYMNGISSIICSSHNIIVCSLQRYDRESLNTN